MKQHQIPTVFRQLCADGCLAEADIAFTRDGFFLANKPLSDILAEKGILDFPDSEGRILPCANFFDDWFLYAVPEGSGWVYSLLKLREQEHDQEGDLPADGDTPGVTVCFISFDCRVLQNCLEDPAGENRKKLNAEINRVVARRGQRHHNALKRYFADPASEGAYLIARLYIRRMASFAENGILAVPDQYRILSRKQAAGNASPGDLRIPGFVASVNAKAGTLVCDGERIYIKDPKHPDPHESAVILATHTGDIDLYSFAAEVEYHARFLFPLARLRLPFIGKSVYDSAIRADMTIGDTEFEGPAPFHRPESKIVKRQFNLHKGESL